LKMHVQAHVCIFIRQYEYMPSAPSRCPLSLCAADTFLFPGQYAGGATSLDDLERVKSMSGGKVDLTIGSAMDIFGGKLPYKDVVSWQRREEEGAK
jgi:hypothetical protein